MIKSIPDEVWAFDCEWVPDLLAGRLLYRLPEELPEQEVLRVMWEQGGATADNPQPFLKTILCRVVSIAAVIRQVMPDGQIKLFLNFLPDQPEDPAQDEKYILKRFLENRLAKNNPQLVGFNSRNSDMRILTQRAITNGLSLKSLCDRLDAKPWESRDVDLMELVSGFGRNYAVSLNELATLCGIPGKMDTSGDDVCGLWYTGQRRKIVEYNCFDALTTYLLWLRLAFFSGCFTAEEHVLEQARVKAMLEERARKPEGAFLTAYLENWRDLKIRTDQNNDGVFEP
ncbi:MAG: 3'-5' exonuclease [Kiritimatiellae bacterium]|nr:3'-5' exonuclease [Kiritimatiellia bacterium]